MNPNTVKIVRTEDARQQIERHFDQWRACAACGLCKTRSKVVLWRGVLPCDVLFIGEGPGRSENTIGVPFVGQAGGVLNDAITAVRNRILDVDYASCHPTEEPFTFAVSNIVSCWPQTDKGETRVPAPKEIEACRSRLKTFIKIAKPKLIITLGKIAAVNIQDALPADAPNVVGIIHPAAVLRTKERSKYPTEFSKLAVPMHDAIVKLVLKGGGS